MGLMPVLVICRKECRMIEGSEVSAEVYNKTTSTRQPACVKLALVHSSTSVTSVALRSTVQLGGFFGFS